MKVAVMAPPISSHWIVKSVCQTHLVQIYKDVFEWSYSNTHWATQVSLEQYFQIQANL